MVVYRIATAGVSRGHRGSLLGRTPSGAVVLISVAETVVLFVSGLFCFKRVERVFAEEV